MPPCHIPPLLLTSTHSLVEAGISVIVASMPSAARIWKSHIVGSPLYNFIRSRFSETRDPTIHSLPSDIKVAKAKASRASRRDLHSIPTLLTTVRSPDPTLHIDQQRKIVGGSLGQQSEEDFRTSLENNAASLDESFLELNNPSGFCEGSSIV
jgi:hypothetical protein